MTILISAYEPNQKLLDLIDALRHEAGANGEAIVIVDDGSGPAYAGIFESARRRGCTILSHERNLGKGRALKTGLAYIREHGEREGVVTADCDGQHTPADILRIAAALKAERNAERNADHSMHGGHHGAIILGCRQFTGPIPLRIRFGSSVTRGVYRFVSGVGVTDTRTGLRGFPMDTVPFALATAGERFTYEMNILLEAPKWGIPLREFAIDTVYAAKEHTSRFKAACNAVRACLPILKFGAASAISALIDFMLLLILQRATGNLLVSVVLSRMTSACFNFLVNKNLVFRMEKDVRQAYSPAFARYAALAMAIMLLNYGLLHLLNELAGIALPLAKLMTESFLYLASYWAQSRYVFAERRAEPVRSAYIRASAGTGAIRHRQSRP